MKKFDKEVAKVQAIIEQAIKDDISAVEVDSSWESVYNFLSITLLKTRITVKYQEWNGIKSKIVTDHVNLKADSLLEYEDTKYMLSWVKRCIKKGYRQAEEEQND